MQWTCPGIYLNGWVTEFSPSGKFKQALGKTEAADILAEVIDIDKEHGEQVVDETRANNMFFHQHTFRIMIPVIGGRAAAKQLKEKLESHGEALSVRGR